MIRLYFLIVFFVINLWAEACDSKLFTFSTPNNVKISVASLLKEIAVNSCGINIIYDDELAKSKFNKLTISGVSVKNYTFSQVLELLVGNNNFFYKVKDGILHIAYVKTKTFNIDYIPSDREGEALFAPSVTDNSSNSSSSNNNSGDTNTVNSHYKFDFWTRLSENLNSILNSYKGEYKAAKAVVDKNTGLVTVTATKRQLAKVKSYIDKINERLHKQIMIDVRIYEVELSKDHKTGIDWSQLNFGIGSKGAPLGLEGGARTIGGTGSIFSQSVFRARGLLNFLATQGNVNSVSNPKLATLNNQKAIISVGKTINYKSLVKAEYTDKNGVVHPAEYKNESKFVGILLDITPEISDDNTIILRINPLISDFDDRTQLAKINEGIRELPPDTDENKMSTVVRIKDGDTLVLGGLITNKNFLKENGVPILKEIPIIKYLFSSKHKISDKVELVFVVTPHIVRENKKITIKELGY